MFSQINNVMIDNTFDHIMEAYYSQGKAQVPARQQIAQIAADTAKMDLVGKLAIGGGIIGIAVSYIAGDIPYVGPLLALAGTVTSLGVGVLGWDMHKAAQNLQVFVDKIALNSATNMISELSYGQKASENDFKRELIETATKGTIIAKHMTHMSKCNK